VEDRMMSADRSVSDKLKMATSSTAVKGRITQPVGEKTEGQYTKSLSRSRCGTTPFQSMQESNPSIHRTRAGSSPVVKGGMGLARKILLVLSITWHKRLEMVVDGAPVGNAHGLLLNRDQLPSVTPLYTKCEREVEWAQGGNNGMQGEVSKVPITVQLGRPLGGNKSRIAEVP